MSNWIEDGAVSEPRGWRIGIGWKLIAAIERRRDPPARNGNTTAANRAISNHKDEVGRVMGEDLMALTPFSNDRGVIDLSQVPRPLPHGRAKRDQLPDHSVTTTRAVRRFEPCVTRSM